MEDTGDIAVVAVQNPVTQVTVTQPEEKFVSVEAPKSAIGTVVQTPVAYVSVVQPKETVVLVGQQGPPGRDGVGAAPPIRITIPSGETSIIQEFEASLVRTAKWIITLTDPIAETFRTLELLALNHNTYCSHAIYNIIGGNLQYDIDVQLVNGKMTLVVTNFGLNSLVVDAVNICSIET